MPAASVRLLAATARMPTEAARLRHTENALAARLDRPELVRRLMETQGSRPVGSTVLSAQASAGSRYAGRLLARIRVALDGLVRAKPEDAYDFAALASMAEQGETT
jgi:hypothetical protein